MNTAYFRTFDETSLAAAWQTDARAHRAEARLRAQDDPSAGRVVRFEHQANVIRFLRKAGRPVTTSEVRDGIGDRSEKARITDTTLRRLVKQGKVARCQPIYEFGRRRSMWTIIPSA